MPIDEILMRDSCGKSRSKIKKYYYYNEYIESDFPYSSNYEELTLLDLIEGTKSFSDSIPLFIPSFLLIFLAVGCIGVWISICVCTVKPKCFCKKDNKNLNRTRFVCLMVFFGFALSVITLGIVLMVYLANAEGDFNGTICSLLMFQYQIINGQGFLSKETIYKPYWYGSNGIGEAISNINNFLSNLKTTCEENTEEINEVLESAVIAGEGLKYKLDALYTVYKDSTINMKSPTNQDIQTSPKYIHNLGPITNNETYIGKIFENYEKNFKYILYDILGPVAGLCTIISGDGGQYLTNGLGGFESVIENLNSMLDNLSSSITKYITKYSNLIINFGYKVNFALFTIVTVVIIIQIILYIIYYYAPFSTIKIFLYIIIHFLNFMLIICFIYNGIFSLLAMATGNMADIVDAALSKENLSSESPRLIEGNENIKKLTRCLRGDGDLFDEFVDEDVKSIVNPLTQLYALYSPVKEINTKINDETKTEYNSLISLDETIEELEKMKEDFILSTTKEISQDYDIATMIDELNKYTMAGRRYQQQCITATYDVWTTTSEHCTQVQADVNIVTGQCKYFSDYYTDPYTTGAERAASDYSRACALINTNDFPDVKSAVKSYITFFSQYKDENDQLINNILTTTNSIPGLKDIEDNFNSEFIDKVKGIIPLIDNDITGAVHNLFSDLLNDTITDTRNLPENFNLFSWMNCTAIGQDYNATLSTLKSNLYEEMKVITYCSLACEILLIACLYIMLGLNKNLRDKIFEINEKRNESHSSDNVEEMEIESNTNKKSEIDSNEVYNIKNKKNFEVTTNIDKKKGIDVNEDLDSDNNGIEHPVRVSINGPAGKPLFKNGENGEMAHIKMAENKNYYKTNSETEEELTSSENKSKLKSSKKTGKITKKSNDEEEEEKEESEGGGEEDDENDGDEENTEKGRSRKTKSKDKSRRTSQYKKTDKSKKSSNKKDSAASSSVSFG